MGCDIWLYAEGFLPIGAGDAKKWINIDHWRRQDGGPMFRISGIQGFDYCDLIQHNRDYQLFYLLAGVRGFDDEKSYPPISPPKGLPEQMDELVREATEADSELAEGDFHNASYLTLRDLKDSGYGAPMRIRGWVDPTEFRDCQEWMESGQECQVHYVDEKDEDIPEGRELREWTGYLNLTHMMQRLEALAAERGIADDREARIVFWFVG